MKKYVFVLVFFIVNLLCGQSGLYNAGVIQLHDESAIGFHGDFINDGVFDNTIGLAGFYGNRPNIVSGAIAPTFYDIEFGNLVGTFLQGSINVVNNTNFISGNVITTRNFEFSFLNYLTDAFYVGETNTAKVFGFAAITNKSSFTFPVGDQNQLRSLVLNSVSSNEFAQCAYFFEDPNDAPSIDDSFDRASRARDIGAVSNNEFWILRGNVTSSITISWNLNSNLGQLTEDITNIRVVAWNIATSRWVILGETEKGGDINEGFITTDNFLPNEYGALTFGSTIEAQELLELDNYFLSPNADGINDTLVIEGMEQSPNNILNIYNRQGQRVFEMTNYTNEFTGISNQNNFVLNREIGLPEGIYYYTVSLLDLDLEYQGFLYLDR
ncbi:gliding motility-associated C-terminal domain-containing protein [Croceitalea rosinachiae]|uniref:Gliding motility-associated C-terminal domain-containing protein n=1 Tax=Croceitalea rosinachiae TaxID=3075596 RepID=A0ABU3A666_9FLAO|nr:gliding motility-associated C-terminal domain-containing protein [Croceitalea sp. F388]MDT0605388.1 gliding motility-associated C-terminal domain-containing protein [Croceitalea sp. F388]